LAFHDAPVDVAKQNHGYGVVDKTDPFPQSIGNKISWKEHVDDADDDEQDL